MAISNPSVLGTDAVLREIENERRRQVVVEKFGRIADDRYMSGELSMAAAAYARIASLREAAEFARRRGVPNEAARNALISNREGRPPLQWPWPAAAWKPKSTRRDLVRAAALLVAEIERIDRRELSEQLQSDAAKACHATYADLAAEITAVEDAMGLPPATRTPPMPPVEKPARTVEREFNGTPEDAYELGRYGRLSPHVGGEVTPREISPAQCAGPEAVVPAGLDAPSDGGGCTGGE